MSAQASSSSSNTNTNLDVLFARGVLARLSTWPALRVALQESWGSSAGADKKSLLASEILDAFQGSAPPNSKSTSTNSNSSNPQAPVDDIYIEDLLLQIMEEEFDVSVEDGSGETVSKDIFKIYEEVYNSEGKARDALVKKFEEAAEKTGKGRVDVSIQREDGDIEDDDDDEEDWEDEDGDGDVQMGEGEEQAPQLIDHQARRTEEPEVDEDGFTMVKGRGKGRR
ncbi:hypothetical protein EST38_g12103 [Candolleomyces aberdarensis]|uniref:Pre-rRNA-processing protein TSR2 n=1 Tax=Candolleomyces aberdarensis TaxID=2316362 RepID=A0A4Q2D390_9AGAR|nr:hypothetical protein EST38_g12103 [Candolleomyces aberdarensis]